MAGQPLRALELVEEAIATTFDEADAPEFRILRGDFISMIPGTDVALAEESYRAAIRGA